MQTSTDTKIWRKEVQTQKIRKKYASSAGTPIIYDALDSRHQSKFAPVFDIIWTPFAEAVFEIQYLKTRTCRSITNPSLESKKRTRNSLVLTFPSKNHETAHRRGDACVI